MEIQKFRILRPLPARDVNWSIPCSGATNLWPLNISYNCSGTTIYDSTFSEIMGFINFNSEFPEKLKNCSITNPCVVVDDNDYVTSPFHCSNIGGHKYLLFKGLNLTYDSNFYQNSYNELSSVIEGFHTSTFSGLLPNSVPCTCVNPLGTDLSQIPIFMSQDYNDIGHYDIWDGNIGQQDTFGNFVLSATSSSGYQITVYRTTDVAYHAGVIDSTFRIDWGDNTITDYPLAPSFALHNYNPGTQKQYKITVIQDTPWGSKSVSNIVTIPHFTYPVMFNQTYLSGTTTVPGSGMTMGHVPLTGLPTLDGTGTGTVVAGTSSAYHGIYGSASTLNYFPLDSATDIDQFSGMTFGPTSVFGIPCYTVSGITDSILGNFQTYTTASTIGTNLPPGYQEGVIVPIGGDVVNPLTNTFETGIYGSIITAAPTYTSYTISSSYGASGGYANGDTPINFWDFSNGITIFEAESCGLGKREFGALECIDCPDDDCKWCQYKDEYVDRTDGTSHQIPGQHPTMGLWDSTAQYNFGEIVYDITWNSCCCYINVGGNPATVVGISPSSMQEGVWTGIHMWEGCSDDCISCPIGTQSPCNDFTISHHHPDSGSVPSGKASYYSATTNYTQGAYVKGGNGNCYEMTSVGPINGINPTGTTGNIHWDYVGCVSWDCPVDVNGTGCVMISGQTLTSNMYYADCESAFNNDMCFDRQWACIAPKYTCLGCEEIFPDDTGGPMGTSRYNTIEAFPDTPGISGEIACLASCSPPAWSCETPTSSTCCVGFNCNDPLTYIDNVYSPATAENGDPTLLKTNWDLYMSPTFDIGDCKDNCCIYSSYTWNCEEGCISQNFLGGYATFGECVMSSNTDTNLNPHIGQVNQASPTGQNYASNGTGIYNSVTNNIPCGWECSDPTTIYNPQYSPEPIDPYNNGSYSSPCTPCFTFGCGGNFINEVDCVTTCSATSNCFVCDCLSVDNCQLVLECPTFAYDMATGTLSTTEFGPNHGVADPSHVHPVTLEPVLTYSSQTGCTLACPCSGYDCAVYRNDHVHWDVNDQQKPGGYGCKSWTEYQLNDNQLTWSNGNIDAPYSSFEECCDANVNCCNVSCVDCVRYPNICNVPGSTNYPCQWWDGNLTPMPSPLFFVYTDPIPPMVSCLNSVFTYPDGSVTCEFYSDCDCACSASTSWINTYYFNSPGGGILGTTTGITLNHEGEWDEVLFDPSGEPISLWHYESGHTVTHEQPVAYSSPCCYICVCVENTAQQPLGGMYAAGFLVGNSDCNHFEPGTGPNANGQQNCWVDCGKGESYPGDPCPPCTPSPNSTWSCAGIDGCQPSLCNYAPTGTTAIWQREFDCYPTSVCDGECYHGCGCDTATTQSVCVMMQDALLELDGLPNNLNLDVFPIPTTWASISWTACDNALSLPGSDCCSPIGTTYNCIADTGCTSDPTTVISGPGQGCVAVYPPTIGMFNFTNLTQTVPGAGSVTFSDPLDACKAFCTWACQNNAGCGFQAWWNYPAPTLNTAYDCWLYSGMDCTNCDETYFCYTGTSLFSSLASGNMSIVTSSDLAALNAGSGPNTGVPEHAASFGPGQFSYNTSQYGFQDEATCQDSCRFKCNALPTSCACELVWGDTITGDISLDECTTQQMPCCFAEWYCMPSDGCTGYMTINTNPAGHQGGPYPQGVLPTEGLAGCMQYCGYGCGDGWEAYGGECMCAFVHNEIGYCNVAGACGLDITGVPGIYQSLADCNTVGAAASTGGVGCCDCYNCIQIHLSNGGVPFPIQTNILNNSPLDCHTTWSPNATSQAEVDVTQTSASYWDGALSVYQQGESVIYDSGGGNTECCYVYNGCCDMNGPGAPCFGQQNLLCGQFPNPEPTKDPHTVWTEYINMLNSLTWEDVICAAGPSSPGAQYYPSHRGLAERDTNIWAGYGGITAGDLWMQGPHWVPCNQGCPA